MTLKSLADANAERAKVYETLKDRPNGIACPACGNEMVDNDASMMLTSNPAQTQISCPSCGYETLRVV